MAKRFICNSCDFEFVAGYSHHMPGAWAFCRECGQVYDVKSTKGYWGFEIGEELHVVRTGKKGKPQVIVVGKGEEFNMWDEIRGQLPSESADRLIRDGKIKEYAHRFIIPIETLQCEQCKRKSLSMQIGNFDKCPCCKVGELHDGGDLIF